MKVALVILLLGVIIAQVSAQRGFGRGGFGRGIGGFGGGFGRGFGFGGGFGRFGGGFGGFGPWGGFGRFGFGGPWGGFGRFGFGGPWGGIGPWGMGGLGMGIPPIGIPPIGIPPVAVAPGLGLGGIGGIGGFGGIGKRDVEEVMPKTTEKMTMTMENRTLCNFTSKKSLFSCHGARHNFECEVIPTFMGLESISYRIHNLTVVPEEFVVENKAHKVFKLFSHKNGEKELNKFSFVEKPEKRITFSIFRSEEVKQNGLRITDEKCWKSFERLVKDSEPESVRFALFISQVQKPVVA